MECQSWIRAAYVIHLIFGSHAPGHRADQLTDSAVGSAGTVSAVGLVLTGRWHSAFYVVTSPSL